MPRATFFKLRRLQIFSIVSFGWSASSIAIAIAALITATPSFSQGTSLSQSTLEQQKKEQLVLLPGMIWTVNFDHFFDAIVIGNPSILDVMPLTDKSVYIQTKQIGLTNVTFFGADNELVGEIEIHVATESGDPKLEKLINHAVSGANILTSRLNEMLYIRGTVGTQNDIDVVLQIAQSSTGAEKPLVYSISYPTATSSTTKIGVTRNGSREVYDAFFINSAGSAEMTTEYGTLFERKNEESPPTQTASPSIIINN